MTTKLVLPFLETMITQVCNLSCHGCTNYSDLVHKGYVQWEQGKASLLPWLNRIEIPDFGIMGGEPLVNPECDKWILGIRQILPDTQIRFTTNGINLDKKMHLVESLKDVGNSVLKITVHGENEQVESTVNKIFKMYDWQPVTEFGIQRYKTDNNFRFQINRPSIFYKTYKNDYENMQPHNSDPTAAFAVCVQQTCPLLFGNRIYKCSTAGLLKNTLARFRNPNIDSWLPLIDHGIGPDCTDLELNTFINNFGKPNSICSQCPTAVDAQSKIVHVQNIKHKKVKC